MTRIDFSMPLTNEVKAYPGDPELNIDQLAEYHEDGYREKRISLNTHTGTHIDAPSHMIETGKTLDQFPLEKFVGTVHIIDVRNQKEIDTDLEHVQPGDFVFFCTNQTAKMAQDNYFETGPVLSEKLAHRIVEKQISIIGIDSYSPDKEPYPVHKILLPHDILIVENLVNLDQHLGKKLQCYITPLPIQDADGAPCRVVCAPLEPNH